MTRSFAKRKASWLALAHWRAQGGEHMPQARPSVPPSTPLERWERDRASRGTLSAEAVAALAQDKPSPPRSGASRPGMAPGLPPLPLRAPPAFLERDPRDWVEFELARVAPKTRAQPARLPRTATNRGQVMVPGGALVFGGERAWRRETVGTP